VTTLAQPGGELRGQLGASRLAAVKLTGAQVTPPVASVASASATFTLSSPQDSIAASVTTSGLAPVDVTAIRLHVGLPGANGNALFTLFSGAGFASPFSATLDVGGFTASPGDGINSFADAINAILAGRTYLDIQTTANPAGEVRSQIGAARLSATLDTAQEVSVPVGLPPVLSGIYHAAPGANGPRLFLISTGAIGSPILGTLDVGNLNFLSGITSFAGVVEALLTSATYFDVATSTNPSGEIRGQILP
jgi:hypothetical protein